MTNTDLKELLDALHDKYNSPDFIADDPISVPHRYTDRADREIAGFFSATIAWGNRNRENWRVRGIGVALIVSVSTFTLS